MRCSTRAENPRSCRRFDLVSKLVWVERPRSASCCWRRLCSLWSDRRRWPCCRLSPASLLLAIRVVVHVVTLPVEFDASFGKALPVLMRGRYLGAGDMPAARSVLKAAAFTYVAAALATLLDVAALVR